MVVLLRAFTHLDAYEDSLERAGLRPYVVGGRGYWSQQQVADACALLATIANPLDDEALLRGARLTRLRASPRTRSGCCAPRPGAAATSGRRSRRSPARRRSEGIDAERLAADPGRGAGLLDRFADRPSPSCGPTAARCRSPR